MKKLILALFFLPILLQAQTVTPTVWKAYQGTSLVIGQPTAWHVDLAACVSWLQTRGVAGTYKCEGSSKVIILAAPPPPPPPPPVITWARIAAEGDTFTVSGTQTVRYGAGTAWIVKDVTASGQCTNEFFGADPIFGAAKTCEVSSASPPPVVTGFLHISWTPPTTNADGTPLTDLAGFVIRYGTIAGAYTQSVTVNDPLATSYQIDGLPVGVYFVVVVAFDTSGNLSSPSSEVTKTIQ
jgi:hypothetical protein